MTKAIGVCLPVDDDKRQFLRNLVGPDGPKLPVVVPNSIHMDCESCGCKVWVGPRMQGNCQMREVMIVCIVCAFFVAKEYGVDLGDAVSLGNPDSKAEQ
jgi:hypothetical protein